MFQTGRSTQTPYQATRPPYVRTLLTVLPLLSLVLVIWACSSSVEFAPPPVTHRPGSELRMELVIAGQYGDLPDVQVFVRIFDGPSVNDLVTLPANATLTCNGDDIKPTTTNYALSSRGCRRQPAGGAYNITYTDEHGKAATVAVPVTKGAFTFTTPRPGGRVRIPKSLLRVSYTSPVLPASASALINGITVTCASVPRNCGIVHAAYQYAPIPTPSIGVREDVPTETPNYGPPTPTPPPGPPPPTPTPYPVQPTPTLPDGIRSPAPEPNGDVATNSCRGADINAAAKPNTSCKGVFDIAGEYARFKPGPGNISMDIEVRIHAIKGDFQATSADFTEGTVSASSPGRGDDRPIRYSHCVTAADVLRDVGAEVLSSLHGKGKLRVRLRCNCFPGHIL